MTKRSESKEVVDVIDVTIKSTLQIPVSKLLVTAITPQLLSVARDPSVPGTAPPKPSFTLCELFQKGKCERREACRLVHVAPEFLRERREKHLDWMQLNADSFSHVPADKTFEVFNATIKEVMEVPRNQLEYTRGLFLSSEDRDKKTVTAANAYCGKVPTACLLHLNGSCKWGEHCNQAHVSRKWLQARNKEFQRWLEDCRVKFSALPPTELLGTYHPNLFEVVKVPKEHIVQFTRGLFQGGEKVPSMCLLFQKGRCSCEELCKQIHVAPEWLAKLRRSAPAGRRSRREAPHSAACPMLETPKKDVNVSFGSHTTSILSPADSPGCSSIASHRSVSPLRLGESSSPLATAHPVGLQSEGLNRSFTAGMLDGRRAGDRPVAPSPPFRLNAHAKPFPPPPRAALFCPGPLPLMPGPPPFAAFPTPATSPHGLPPPPASPAAAASPLTPYGLPRIGSALSSSPFTPLGPEPDCDADPNAGLDFGADLLREITDFVGNGPDPAARTDALPLYPCDPSMAEGPLDGAGHTLAAPEASSTTAALASDLQSLQAELERQSHALATAAQRCAALSTVVRERQGQTGAPPDVSLARQAIADGGTAVRQSCAALHAALAPALELCEAVAGDAAFDLTEAILEACHPASR